VSRLSRSERTLQPDSKEGQLAALLIRVFRSLDALVGNDAERRTAWMTSHNHALNGVPRQLIETPQGLVTTLVYLDAMRSTS
jgi:hypothetical protein